MNKYGTILIVDDNAAILTAMRYLLDGTFEQVLTTTNPDDILKLMAQQTVDIVVLDMNFTLGVNNGNEGLFWLRTIRKQHAERNRQSRRSGTGAYPSHHRPLSW